MKETLKIFDVTADELADYMGVRSGDLYFEINGKLSEKRKKELTAKARELSARKEELRRRGWE